MHVECFPATRIAEVFIEAGEEALVHGSFAALLAVPESIGSGFGDGVVDPSWWNVVVEFVVEDFLEWRDDLGELALNKAIINAIQGETRVKEASSLKLILA